MNKNYSKKKRTGATFTPPHLAKYVARNIINYFDFNRTNISVLDPACGDGELLHAFITELPKKYLSKINILGIENNKESINKANNRLGNFPVKSIKFIEDDFLKFIPAQNPQLPLFKDNQDNHNVITEKVDIIIANPPYVRTQILGSKQAQILAKKFNINGKLDLYQVFLAAMTYILSAEGIIGVIISNRFITNKSGGCTRKTLLNSYQILKLVDLGDTKLFDAAVLPAIFFGKKTNDKVSNNNSNFIRIYENNSMIKNKINIHHDIYSVIENEKPGYFSVNNSIYELSKGTIVFPNKTSDPWRLLSDKEKKFIRRIENNSKYKLLDFAKVRVGIKSNADKVFLRNDWNLLPTGLIPENELLKPVLSSKESNCFLPIVDENKRKFVLYPHKKSNGKREVVNLDDFPKAKKYFKSHIDILKSRKYLIKANRKWYELWVPQDPELWKYPKIVFPDISPTPKFFYDDSGAIIDGNCYWITMCEKYDNDLLFLFLGLFNSITITKYHDLCFNNKLYSGRKRYFTQFVEKYPIPDIQKVECRNIIKIVKQIIKNKEKNTEPIKKKLNDLVNKAFNL